MLFANRMDPGSFWLLVGAVGATTLVMFRIAARRRRGHADDRPAVELQGSVSSRPPRGVERWEADLHEFTREIEGRLNNKIAALQQLLVEADQRIATLESLGVETNRTDSDASSSPRLAGPHYHESSARRGEQASVFAMHDAGQGAAAIANRLQLPIGEVELILSLRSSPGN